MLAQGGLQTGARSECVHLGMATAATAATRRRQPGQHWAHRPAATCTKRVGATVGGPFACIGVCKRWRALAAPSPLSSLCLVMPLFV